MKTKKYTKKQFIKAVKESTSIRQVLIKLQLKPAGGNYKSFHNTVEDLSLDISHFTGKAHNKGKRYTKIPIEDYISNKKPIQSFRLKNRLIKENIFNESCSECSLTEWNSQPIPLELDHIDGNPNDNSLDNLRLLCPNCHALTPNYRGKNKRKI